MALAQNYPNPFNPQTKIDFALPASSNVRLEVYDLLGRRISTLVDGPYQPGRYSVIWNGKDAAGSPVASGVYFYRLTTDAGVQQEKMTLVR
jgi:flagellar hook assembly protein FlgD